MQYNSATSYNLDTGEADQVGAETEARTLARRQANARGEEVEERERHRCNNRHRENLLHIQLLLGDDERRQRHREALQEILDCTGNKLSNCETVHLIFRGVKKTYRSLDAVFIFI